MKINLAFIIFGICLLGCKKEAPTPELTLPASQIFLQSQGETLSDLSFSACDNIPSPTEVIGTDPSLLLFSPGIFLTDGIGRMENDIGFYFIFHNVDVAFSGAPSYEEFWDHLQQEEYDFNEIPFKRDFFLKIKKDGEVYQNWWNGDLLSGFGTNISKDETGLKFTNTQFSRFDEFGDICTHDYQTIRLQGDVEGYLITENRDDTLKINGNLDLFLHISKE